MTDVEVWRGHPLRGPRKGEEAWRRQPGCRGDADRVRGAESSGHAVKATRPVRSTEGALFQVGRWQMSNGCGVIIELPW